MWETSEHTGLATLAKGVHGTYRNPPAHAPAVRWATDRAEAMDLLTIVSMLHRRPAVSATTVDRVALSLINALL